MKIALLDLSIHKKTNSTRFFGDLLRRLGTTQVFYIDENVPSILAEIADIDFDLIVLMQTEFCAPYFLARGKRTLIVPMYDGCGNLPDLYWRAMASARAVSFSRRLYKRMLTNGVDSHYLQYFPDPKLYTPMTDFTNLRGFFWQRRPKQGMTWQLVSGLVPDLEKFHVHLAADDGAIENDAVAAHMTVSHWSADNSLYKRHLEAANVFFAPRLTEGIGLANLEAMARGMCVVAHDDVTANEYIVDQVNGRLYDINNPKNLIITPALAEKYGQAARRSVEQGYEKFNTSLDDLLWFIEFTPKPNPNYATHFPAKRFIRAAYGMFSNIYGMLAIFAEAEGTGAFIREEKRFYPWQRIKARLRHIPLVESVAWRIYCWLRRQYARIRSRLSE